MPRWSETRRALSLLAGQGASLGMSVLADQLNRASSISEGLLGCERLWRPVGRRELTDS
ncbi:hypothetical protein F9C11_16890 [Amycolatopsis sp. VS8301801F10]|uniref:hypothetical protein n=1 Tax=Amycolatopsis sp. VS8301801F10 TaxID=2652442 RepID=UPI0038FD3B93